jgi:hypothetical protein
MTDISNCVELEISLIPLEISLIGLELEISLIRTL